MLPVVLTTGSIRIDRKATTTRFLEHAELPRKSTKIAKIPAAGIHSQLIAGAFGD